MAKKKSGSITEAYEALPKLLKLIIQLVFGVIVGGIYRIIRYVENKNLATLVVGLLVTFTGIGNLIIWVVDFVTQLLINRITVFAD